MHRVLSAADQKDTVWNIHSLTSIAERSIRVPVRDDLYDFVATPFVVDCDQLHESASSTKVNEHLSVSEIVLCIPERSIGARCV